MAAAGQGLGPWEVFHQGISRQTGIPLGTVSIILGVPILLMWLPLREQPGIGTVLNIVLIGVATNAALTLLPTPPDLAPQLAMMALGVVTIGVASGLYLSTDLGAGPRDGLMTGLHHRFGFSIRRARTAPRAYRAGRRVSSWVAPSDWARWCSRWQSGRSCSGHSAIFDPSGAVARRRAASLGPAPVPMLDALEGPAE